MEYFFKRLEAYIKIRPTKVMTDVMVETMVEVISILGIVTKEIRQGRTSMPFLIDISPKLDLHAEKYLKKLLGRKDVEDALQRLDKLTQEEARMAAAEALRSLAASMTRCWALTIRSVQSLRVSYIVSAHPLICPQPLLG